MAEAKKSKTKCRQYSMEYLNYGFIPASSNQQLPQCLMCGKIFSNEAMKPCGLNEHLKKAHSDKADKNLTFFQSFHDKFQKRPTLSCMFSNASQQNTCLHASYNISLLIAKSGKPHTIGEELILPAIKEVLSTVLHKSPHDIIKTIPLSNNSVQRFIDEMAENVEDVLCSILWITDLVLQLDESTLPGNESFLLAYVRFIKDESLTEELLFARQLNTDTKGESIFHVVEEFFKDKEIPLTNILACATDGAPSMTGRYRGCVAYLKKTVPNVFTIHCVIHRQQLVAKTLSDRLSKSLHIVITAVNKIKVHALSDRLFRELCVENDEDFDCLLLHTEVHWPSKGNCLRCFYNLFDTVAEFFEGKNALLSDELKEIRHDIAYLSELFTKFNEVNLQLQGNEVNLIKAKSVISTFILKLALFKRNIGRCELYQFPSLSELEKKGGIQDDDLHVFCDHLDMLHKDMSEQYQDLILMEIPDWVINQFLDTKEDGVGEEQLIELKNDIELKPKFKKSYQEFWLQKEISDCYPALWTIVKKLLVAFPTSYLVERGFQLLSKQRNRLQITERGDLRLLLSDLKPDIRKLVSIHQAHPSH
ncbi:LOW QUALITY PROTEIN: zinc finger MYM-type protein 6-like [Pseudonaja textilis]|uniref:LOW QUALITY PROTEIN: zinc finger MYM-type protein 6-like n=1 Tax=Pseudonaja textilis TaxID=8673 RepID=UPI000EA8E9E7|nr:LOW QUALITY PROTEIN: zinc finger MYM-type protein 6-like [Pseudonaja textilis]